MIWIMDRTLHRLIDPMIRPLSHIAVAGIFLFLGLASCSKTSTDTTSSTAAASAFTNEQYLRALRSASLRILYGLPEAADVDSVLAATDPASVYNSLIDGYLNDEAARAAFTDYFRVMFGMGANVNNSSDDDPTRLALYIVMSDLPYTDLATANYKIDANGIVFVGQDTGAPTNELAGFLTLKAWLDQYEGNGFLFNYTREVARALECYEYPDPDAIGAWDEANIAEKYLSRDGVACFDCHKTLDARRCVWYKFGNEGAYRTNPNPAQLYGHEEDDYNGAEVKEPRAGQVCQFTAPMSTPADYAGQIIETDRFKECTARRFLAFALGYHNGDPGPNGSGSPPFDFKASSKAGDPELLDNWTARMVALDYKIRPFLAEFFKSADFILRVNLL